MKFKTKYNIGDIVEFRRIDMNRSKIGSISEITIRYSLEKNYHIVCYNINTFEFDKPLYVSISKTVPEYEIVKKLDSKAFLKKYSELAAEKIVKGDNA